MTTLKGEIPSPNDIAEELLPLWPLSPAQVDRCRTTPQILTALPDGRQVRCWRVDAGEV